MPLTNCLTHHMRSQNMNAGQPNLPTRRHLIQAMGGGMGSLGLLSVMNSQAHGELPAAHVPAKAKRVIQLFMNGGPFHGDLFDPKPQLLKFAGQHGIVAVVRIRQRECESACVRCPVSRQACPFFDSLDERFSAGVSSGNLHQSSRSGP